MLSSRSMPIISIAHKKNYSRATFWGPSLPDMKPPRASQMLFSRSMPIISIAHKKNLTTFNILGAIAAGHETPQSISNAVFQFHAYHKHSPKKKFNHIQHFGGHRCQT